MTTSTYRAVVRRCAFAPVLGILGGCTPLEATVAAYKFVKNTKLFGFIIELEERIHAQCD